MENYKTRDMFEAALIYAKHSDKFVELEPEGRDYLFVFSDKDVCEKLSKEYYSKKAEVNAKDYSDALRTIKDFIFSKKRYDEHTA